MAPMMSPMGTPTIRWEGVASFLLREAVTEILVANP